jgi:hypothetical protein
MGAAGFVTPPLTFCAKSRHPIWHKTFRTGLQIPSGFWFNATTQRRNVNRSSLRRCVRLSFPSVTGRNSNAVRCNRNAVRDAIVGRNSGSAAYCAECKTSRLVMRRIRFTPIAPLRGLEPLSATVLVNPSLTFLAKSQHSILHNSF